MPTLRRDDGVQFVVQSYRELLGIKSISALKREIRTLAKNHGEFIRCYKQESGQLEVVFSREPGFLLGETVWNHFGRPQDLIYCEALPDKQHTLLVIVRSGSVYLDAKVVYSDLMDEFSALFANNEQYLVCVCGDVPLSDAPSEDAFVFDSNSARAFKRFPESVFAKLELDVEFQLQPLELALTASKFSRPIFFPLLFACIILFLAIGLWHWYVGSLDAGTNMQKPIVNPYAIYYEAMATPDPNSQLKELTAIIGQTYGLPGWQLVSIEYKNGKYIAKLSGSVDNKKFVILMLRLLLKR